jgi:hypothetical protein
MSNLNSFQLPYCKDIYTLETLIVNFIPSAIFTYDPYGQVVIHTDLMTDDDGNLIEFKK